MPILRPQGSRLESDAGVSHRPHNGGSGLGVGLPGAREFVRCGVANGHVVIHDEQDIGSADCDLLGHRHTEEGGMEDREQNGGDETRDDGYPVHREARRLVGR